MKGFIADLHSGKLHREFHHGPDPVVVPNPEVSLSFLLSVSNFESCKIFVLF